ncbi:flavodoxin [Hymenobacter defluvii]|uniref:Flavodoxin n=1 Tax=Hymenobacter defluvii TaxID=2054411 RepID=A0ABS3TGQ3_9BACT|nr:flavodoxin [Hymenobacter defluvii]MBO3272368.1 flavodoxin [Hymenobacter defluvii]
MKNLDKSRLASARSLSRSLTSWLVLCVLLISACSFAKKEDIQAPVKPTASSKNVLIVYLSRTNNTKAVAGIIHQEVGGSLIALELQTPYPENYQAIVQQVARENETGFLPPLRTRIHNIAQYDVIFVGFPTWGMQLPPPMKSFLKQYDLRGKTLVPFNTNAGYGVGTSMQMVKALAPNSTVLEGFSTRGGIERDGVLFVMEGNKEKQVQQEVRAWLQKINLLSKQ